MPRHKVSPVDELPPAIPMPEDIAACLERLKGDPGVWYAIDAAKHRADPRPHRAHTQRARYVEVLQRRSIDGYEFTVRERVMYGRYTPPRR